MKLPLVLCLSVLACSILPPLHGEEVSKFRDFSLPISRIQIDESKIAVQLYVAPNGNDAFDGTTPDGLAPHGPFATLARARDQIRSMKEHGGLPAGGVAVNLRGGVYSLDASLELTEKDSGTPVSPVVYRPYKNEEPRILGGKVLKPTDFAPVTDPDFMKRLAPEAKGHALQASIDALHLAHGGPFPNQFSDGGGVFELFFNGERMHLSRWPAEGYVTMKETIVNGDKNTPGVFTYREDEPKLWNVAAGVWLKGQWRVGWEDPAIKVASIDPAKKQIAFAVGVSGGIGNKYTRPKGSGTEPWCAINLPEELKKPGQWCIDFPSRTLFFWPPAPLTGADVMASQLDTPLVSMVGASNIAFLRLTFEGSLGGGIVNKGGKSDLIAGCTLRNLGGDGVVIEGYGNGVQSCDMYKLGQACILMAGGDKKTLTPSCNYAINNHLHHYGALRAQYSAAIDLYRSGVPSVGCLIANNLIHHAPRDGVLFGGQDNILEYNEIYRCAYDSTDTGAFYSWMDWTIRGVVIRYNFVHDTVGGVNPDDGASGTFVYGNVFAGDRTGVYIASGPDHTIQNNIFVKSQGPAFGMDDRGLGRKYAIHPRLLKDVQDIHPTQAPWSVKYPEMAHLLQEHPELPLRTAFKQNLVFIGSGEPYSIKMRKENVANPNIIHIKDNFVTSTDPGFVNLAQGDYTLKKDSVAFKKIPGFQPIPMSKIGLYIDSYRKRLPTPEEAGRLPSQDPWKPSDTNRNFGT